MNALPRILLETLLLASLGAAIGLAVNHRLLLEVFAGRLTAPILEQTDARLPQPVLLAEVRDLINSGALPVDARDGALYADGHLPGAIPLPLGDVEPLLEEFRRKVGSTRTLILYCSGYGCADSFDLGLRLLKEGYQDVRVFEGGFPEWRDAGLPVDKGLP